MQQITNLNLASSNAISASLSNLRGSFNARNAWLTSGNNKYIIDTLEELKTDFAGGNIVNNQVVDYLASSVCIHCFNGWSYLSSAIRSLLEGDYGNAIHNAYYAELRSIKSILGSQGIGVFDKYNLIVDSQGTVHRATPINRRTHVFAKEAFDQWLNIPSNAETIFKLITVESHTLKQWTDATGFSESMPSILAADWLKNWSLDLVIINGEHKFRNFVSYNPQIFDLNINRQSDNIKKRLEFIIELWKLCAPENLFAKSTLRNSLEVYYKTLFNYSLSQLDISKDWGLLLTSLGMNPNDMKSQYLIKFFTRQIEPTDNILFEYAKNIISSNPLLESDTEPMGIISRACLLLLINTKILETTFRQTGVTNSDLTFWFDNIGLRLGFWDSATKPYLFSDLWKDVDLDIDEINKWIKKPGNTFSPYNLKSELKKYTAHINNINQSLLWGVGL